MDVPLAKIFNELNYKELLEKKKVKEIRETLKKKIFDGISESHTEEISYYENVDILIPCEGGIFLLKFKNDSEWKDVITVVKFFDHLNVSLSLQTNKHIVKNNF